MAEHVSVCFNNLTYLYHSYFRSPHNCYDHLTEDEVKELQKIIHQSNKHVSIHGNSITDNSDGDNDGDDLSVNGSFSTSIDNVGVLSPCTDRSKNVPLIISKMDATQDNCAPSEHDLLSFIFVF